MDKSQVKEMLENVAAGSVSVDDALMKLRMEPFEEMGIANLDHHRGLRQGASEVIYGAGKTPQQIDMVNSNMYISITEAYITKQGE